MPPALFTIPTVASPEKLGRELNSLLPMLSTPRGMITSAYFFVCKTATVVETVNGKSQLYSRKKPPNTRKLGGEDGGVSVLQGCKLELSVMVTPKRIAKSHAG